MTWMMIEAMELGLTLASVMASRHRSVVDGSGLPFAQLRLVSASFYPEAVGAAEADSSLNLNSDPSMVPAVPTPSSSSSSSSEAPPDHPHKSWAHPLASS